MNDRIYNGGIEKLRSPERLARLEVDRVVALCTKENNISSLLDIGTGTAVFAEAFSKQGIKVDGIDINEELLNEARKVLPNNTFKIAPAEALPYPDLSFDATFFGLVFHEVSDYQKSLEEAFRVSRKVSYILDWDYKVQEVGPPLEHRIKSEFIKEIAYLIKYKEVKKIELAQLVLYILNKV